VSKLWSWYLQFSKTCCPTGMQSAQLGRGANPEKRIAQKQRVSSTDLAQNLDLKKGTFVSNLSLGLHPI